MTGILRIREELHNKLLRLRSIESVVLTDRFERLWEVSTKKQREEVQKFIDLPDKQAIIKWMKNHPSLDLGEMDTRALKERAKRLQIPNWSRMQKTDLIRAIQKKEK